MDFPYQAVTEATSCVLNVDTLIDVGQLPVSLDLELENVWIHHTGAAAIGTAALYVDRRPFTPLVRLQGTFAEQLGDPIRQIPLGLIIPKGSFLGVLIRPTATVDCRVWIWGNLVEPMIHVRKLAPIPDRMPTLGARMLPPKPLRNTGLGTL